MDEAIFDKAREIRLKINRLESGKKSIDGVYGEIKFYVDLPSEIIDRQYEEMKTWMESEIIRLKKEFAEL